MHVRVMMMYERQGHLIIGWARKGCSESCAHAIPYIAGLPFPSLCVDQPLSLPFFASKAAFSERRYRPPSPIANLTSFLDALFLLIIIHLCSKTSLSYICVPSSANRPREMVPRRPGPNDVPRSRPPPRLSCRFRPFAVCHAKRREMKRIRQNQEVYIR